MSTFHGENSSYPDLVSELRGSSDFMNGESKDRQDEKNGCIDFLEAYYILKGAPNKAKTCTTKKT